MFSLGPSIRKCDFGSSEILNAPAIETDTVNIIRILENATNTMCSSKRQRTTEIEIDNPSKGAESTTYLVLLDFLRSNSTCLEKSGVKFHFLSLNSFRLIMFFWNTSKFWLNKTHQKTLSFGAFCWLNDQFCSTKNRSEGWDMLGQRRPEEPMFTRFRWPPLMPRRSTLPTRLCCTSTNCITFSTSSTMYLGKRWKKIKQTRL